MDDDDDDDDAGVDRARRENYAFILDSPTAEYVASRDPCDLYTIEPFLDVAAYAFAVRKRSTPTHQQQQQQPGSTPPSTSSGFNNMRELRQAIDREMRRLKQSGEMQTMYLRWWRDECSSSPSAAFDDDENVGPAAPGGARGSSSAGDRRPSAAGSSRPDATESAASGDVARRHTRPSSTASGLMADRSATWWWRTVTTAMTSAVVCSNVFRFARFGVITQR